MDAKWTKYGRRVFTSELVGAVAFAALLYVLPMSDPRGSPSGRVLHTCAHIVAVCIYFPTFLGEVVANAFYEDAVLAIAMQVPSQC